MFGKIPIATKLLQLHKTPNNIPTPLQHLPAYLPGAFKQPQFNILPTYKSIIL